jgi:ATP-dependent Lon protease
MEGRRRIKEQLKKLAPHEYSKTSFSYIERDTEGEFWVEVPEQPDNAVSETIHAIEEDADVSQERHSSGHESRLSLQELLRRGESRTVEFKSSARWNLHRGERDPAVEREIVKAISGFMNAEGGTLLIGVNDEHEVVGLENDYKVTKKGNRDPHDSFENWLTDLLDNTIGKAPLSNVSVTFEEAGGRDVCRVEARRSRAPVFAQGKQSKDFFVRLNNGTRSLDVEETMQYLSARS